LSICGSIILACFSLGRVSAEAKPEDPALILQTLEDFHYAEQTTARKPVVAADASYRYRLEKYQKTSQAAGNLKAVLAAKQALDELDAGEPVSISGDAEVAKIQKAYTAERRRADAATGKALAKINQDYLASLRKLVTDLTKSGHIDQAVKVQEKVDELSSLLSQKDNATNPDAASSDTEEWKSASSAKSVGETVPNRREAA
jgi:hypothetical protein